MLASQYIISGIIILIFIRTLITAKVKKLPAIFTVIWLSIWFTAFIFTLSPYLLTTLAKFLKIGRGVDLAVYTSIIIIFYLIYLLFVKLNDIEEKITKIVREKALKD